MYPMGHLPQRKPRSLAGSHGTPGKQGRSAQEVKGLSSVVVLLLVPGRMEVGLWKGEPWTLLPDVVRVKAGMISGSSGSNPGSVTSPSAENSDSDRE